MERQLDLLVIEDNLEICGLIRALANDEAFNYAADAHTRDEAIARIQELQDGSLRADVVLLDGALSDGSRMGEDAEILYPKIREAAPAALVIGISAFELANQCPGIHDLTKPDLLRLGGFVRELLDRTA